MNKWKNEKGNTLILVLLITVVFTTLGMGIIAATIGGTKRTVIREEDVDITYEAVKIVDGMISDLSIALKDHQYEIGTLRTDPAANFDPIPLLKSIGDAYEDRSTIEFEDLTEQSPYLINPSESLTRVVEMKVTTKTAETTGDIDRTATKRIIISPLPSFLKYALGSEDGILKLQGSPHFEGNVFANRLEISENAQYKLNNNDDPEKIDTLLPSITGDIFAGTAAADKYESDNFQLSDMLEVLKENYFYKGNVPELKSDSQYQAINFARSFQEELDNRLKKTPIFDKGQLDDTIPANKASNVKIVSPPFDSQITTTTVDGIKQTTYPDPYRLINQGTSSEAQLAGNLVISGTQPLSFQPLYINGDVEIVANNDMNFEDLHVTGMLTIVVNNGTVKLNSTVVNGGGIIINTNENGKLEVNEALFGKKDIIVDNIGELTVNEPIQTDANLAVANQGKFESNAHLLAYEQLSIENSGDLDLLAPEDSTGVQENIFAGTDMTITNEGEEADFTLKNHLVSDRNMTLDMKARAVLTGDILAAGKAAIYSRDAQTDFDGTLFSEKTLIVQGNASDPTGKENDILSVKGVMYAKEQTSVSNLFIEELNDGQLVLLSGGELLITRINEFSNFDDSDELGNSYVPVKDRGVEDPSLKPLKGFFYTDKTAELYGVGSLFYIDGGLFANGDLTVNAIRGEINSIDEADSNNAGIDQKDHYSRFIINHDSDILLENIDALPKVDYLSIYSDQLTVE
jgi:hypothetical protein